MSPSGASLCRSNARPSIQELIDLRINLSALSFRGNFDRVAGLAIG
jgi:hypothetical protein